MQTEGRQLITLDGFLLRGFDFFGLFYGFKRDSSPLPPKCHFWAYYPFKGQAKEKEENKYKHIRSFIKAVCQAVY